jgi:hypothetical protein
MCGNGSWHTYGMRSVLPPGTGCDRGALSAPFIFDWGGGALASWPPAGGAHRREAMAEIGRHNEGRWWCQAGT